MCHLQDMASVDPAFYDSKVAYILEGRYQDTDAANPYGPIWPYDLCKFCEDFMGIVPQTGWSLAGISL